MNMIQTFDDNQYKVLLESTKAIPWRLDWQSQQFTYIGPQIETLLGWEPDSWKTTEDWAERMHPEDRERIVNYCVTQSSEGIDHEADYRASTKNGGYIWVRDVVHVIRNGDTVESLVGFIFDITERKNAENKQNELIDALQEALNEIKTLKGIIPICGYCHSIRDDEGAWARLEQYLSKHSDAEFSHGICPKCVPKFRLESGLDKI